MAGHPVPPKSPAAHRDAPRAPRAVGARYAATLLILLLSGFTCLSYEYLWSRRLVDLIGATPESTARVFGCFFVGLAAGALLSAYVSKRVGRLWLFLACGELAIVLLAIPLLTLHTWSGWIWNLADPAMLATRASGLYKFVVSFLVLTPPAVIMGVNLPLAAKMVLHGGRTLARQGTWLYAANTTGGLLGLLVVPSVLFPLWGISGAMLATMGLNVLLCAAYLALHRAQPLAPAAPETPASPPPAPRPNWRADLVAFVSGAAILSVEVFGLHMFNQVVPTPLYASSIVLGCVIALLAAASWATPHAARAVDSGSWTPMALLLVAAGGATLCVAPLFNWSSANLSLLVPRGSTVGFVLDGIRIMFVALAPCILVGGLVFPLLFKHLEGAAGGASIAAWGRMLAINGLGGFFGSEVANNVLMPRFGFNSGTAVVGVLYLGTALVVGWPGTARPRALQLGTLVALGVGAWLALGPIARLPQMQSILRSNRSARLLELATGPEGVLAIVEGNGVAEEGIIKRGKMMLLNNSYILGGNIMTKNQTDQAVVAGMLHPAPRKVAVIGLATGITAGTLLAYPDVEQVTAVEISRDVIEQARRHFAPSNNGVFTDPRAQVVNEDGRIYLAASKDAFDLVLADLFRPHDFGCGRLYSVEHFQAVRRALREGGVFCQWLSMDMFQPAEFESVLASFLTVFPKAYVVASSNDSNRFWRALVGFKEADLDLEAVGKRYRALADSGKVEASLLRSPDELSALVKGVAEGRLKPHVPLTTLDNGWVEISANRSMAAWKPARRSTAQ